VNEGMGGHLIQREGFPEPDMVGLFCGGMGDPFAFPIARIEKSDRKRGFIAPRGEIVIHVPHPDSPLERLVRPERLATVFDVHRLAGFDLAGIPHGGIAAGGDDLPRRLALTS
jgi:hypothetical protein